MVSPERVGSEGLRMLNFKSRYFGGSWACKKRDDGKRRLGSGVRDAVGPGRRVVSTQQEERVQQETSHGDVCGKKRSLRVMGVGEPLLSQ